MPDHNTVPSSKEIGEAFNNSIPFDFDGRLRGTGAPALLDSVMKSVADHEPVRARALRTRDKDTRRRTLEALLSNLLRAGLHYLDESKYVATPFKRQAYSGTGLSVDAMTLARDSMLKAGLIEGAKGFLIEKPERHSAFGRLSRWRATDALRDLWDCHEITLKAVKPSDKPLLRLGEANVGVPANPPPHVEASQSTIELINKLIASSDISLTEEGRALAVQAPVSRKTEPMVGDLTAVRLYRIFKGDWESGGRLYGGWWQGLRKEARPHLTINNEPTVELDYVAQHPSILYAWLGYDLQHDPYQVPGLAGDWVRPLAKVALPQLLHRGNDLSNLRRPVGTPPPKGLSYKQFVQQLAHHNAPITEWFGTEPWGKLQYADSNLAVTILERLASRGITALPIHDSFVVKCSHEADLRQEMQACYKEKFNFIPLISSSSIDPGGTRSTRDRNP